MALVGAVRATVGMAKKTALGRKSTRPDVRSAAASGALGLAHALAAIAIALGWLGRKEHYLRPDEGLGYLLGILGLSLMLMLLLYSLRKRFRFMRHRGRISSWFQLHMILGLAGPVAILFHSNFQLGSRNSNIALACTLMVAASGVVGRMVHGRIHHRLSGRRTSLDEIRQKLGARRLTAGESPASRALARSLRSFEERVLASDRGVVAELRAHWLLGHRCRRAVRAAARTIDIAAREAGADRASVRRAMRAVKTHVRAVRLVARFGLYERIFGLWHIVHLPLCFLLFATAAVHVVAVHMY